MKIYTYSIPEELQNNDFIKSIYNQSQTKELSKKQINVLEDMLGVELEEPKYDTQRVKVYLKYFYRYDYHGDMLKDYTEVYNVNEAELNDKIQDGCAAQHSYESYDDKYKFKKEILIPSNIENISNFMRYYEDYKIIVEKVKRNKFRKIQTKNNTYRVLSDLIEEKYDDTLIAKASGRFYR